MKKIISLSLILALATLASSEDPIGPIRGFIQTNIIGKPVLHNQQPWVFDPDVSLRRRRQFISIHGDKGEFLIERLGLGIDGYEEERLKKQRLRDEGHLGGLNFYNP